MPGTKTNRRPGTFVRWIIAIWVVFVTTAAVIGWMYGIAATNAMNKFIAADQAHTNHDYNVSVDLPNPLTGTFGWLFGNLSNPWFILAVVLLSIGVSRLRKRIKRNNAPAPHTNNTP